MVLVTVRDSGARHSRAIRLQTDGRGPAEPHAREVDRAAEGQTPKHDSGCLSHCSNYMSGRCKSSRCSGVIPEHSPRRVGCLPTIVGRLALELRSEGPQCQARAAAIRREPSRHATAAVTLATETT
jgi:hypothetical protein